MSDEPLLARLRELSMVDLDVLTLGLSGELYDATVDHHIIDLGDALTVARTRLAELKTSSQTGVDPLAVVEMPRAQRASEKGRELAAGAAAALDERASGHRHMANLLEAAARVVPKLLEAERRRGR